MHNSIVCFGKKTFAATNVWQTSRGYMGWNIHKSRLLTKPCTYSLRFNTSTLGQNCHAAISQATFSTACSWKQMYEFRLRFHWSLFWRFELTIFEHWFNGLVPTRYKESVFSPEHNEVLFVFWFLFVCLSPTKRCMFFMFYSRNGCVLLHYIVRGIVKCMSLKHTDHLVKWRLRLHYLFYPINVFDARKYLAIDEVNIVKYVHPTDHQFIRKDTFVDVVYYIMS